MPGNKLKPCPFCGSRTLDVMGERGKKPFYVVCWNCGANGPSHYRRYGITPLTISGAIKSWNRRQNEK